MNKARKLITFDLYDTLIKPKLSIGKHYDIVLKNYGLNLNVTDINTNFLKSYKIYESKFPNMGYHSNLSTYNWWKMVTKDTLFNTDPNSQILKQKFDQIFHDIYSNFARKENYMLFDDVIPLLDELKRKGYELGIVSNMDERARDILKEFELIKYFKYILLSRECGVMKPNPQIFLIMNRLSKIEPADCYHIGDDFEKDFKACEKANWNGIWLNRECNNNYNKFLDQVPASKLVDKLDKFKL